MVLRSDIIRKCMFGVGPKAPLAPDAYSKDVTADVYRQMVESAAMALADGFTVIAAAVHARPEERTAMEAVASGWACRLPAYGSMRPPQFC